MRGHRPTAHSRIEDHYRAGAPKRVMDALESAGNGGDSQPESGSSSSPHLGPEEKPIDQMHLGGADVVRSLAHLVELEIGSQVLDVGCGVGGPARLLATEFGCTVTGVDLTGASCRAARSLSDHLRLSGRTHFAKADATVLPFADDAFEVAWSQHVNMNIANKTAFFAEISRILAPEGRLALHEICAGESGPPHYPAPWADDASMSHLMKADELRECVRSAGLRELQWRDETESAIEWCRSAVKAPGGTGRLSTLLRNLEEGRVGVRMGVFAG